jgi:hypothetical protein
MEFLDSLRDYIKNVEDRDLYKYVAIFFGALFLLFGLLAYFHYNRLNKYANEIKKVDSARNQTKKLLKDYKVVQAQKQRTEEILAQNPNFRIGEAYQSIIQKSGLAGKLQDQSAPTTGESFADKIEMQVNSQFTGLSMKQVTDLLAEIAATPQLYTKELTIKKVPNMSAVDVNITVATLEPRAI